MLGLMLSSWFFFWNNFYVMYVQNLSFNLHKRELYICFQKKLAVGMPLTAKMVDRFL